MEDDAWGMDKCMDSIRCIKERIKSCISCNEDQCPFIKERLEQHLLSHRSSTSRSLSRQQIKYLRKSSGVVIPSTSDVTVKKNGKTTSTSELNLSIEDTNYKEALRNIIYDWAKDLQVNNGIAEKHNMLNDLLENLYDLASEVNKDYDDKLNNVIDNFLDHLSIQIGSSSKDVKEYVIDKIHELNDERENSRFNKEANRRKYKKRADENAEDSIINTSGIQNLITARDKQGYMKSVGVQVQNSLTDNISSHDNILESKDNKVFELKILKWLTELNNENYLNIDDNNKKFVADNLYNRLKQFLDIKNYKVNDKLLLRGEILNFLLENMSVTNSNENIARLNRLANNLALDLLAETNNALIYNTLYDLDETEEKNDENVELMYSEEIYDIVVSSLDKYHIYYSDYLIDEIVCLLENYSMKVDEDNKLENEIFTILKRSTGLSDYNIADITINIIEDVIAVKDNNFKRYGNVDKIISVYNSEYDLSERFNNFTINRKIRMVNKYPAFKFDDRDNVTEIIFVITSWVHTLPVESQISKESKELFVNNLANDILDQVKLGYLAGLNIDEEKYIYFSIYKWLNRFQYFENINDAKPFLDKLVKRLKDLTPQSITNIQMNNCIFNNNEDKAVDSKLGDEDYIESESVVKECIEKDKEDIKDENKLRHGNLKHGVTQRIVQASNENKNDGIGKNKSQLEECLKKIDLTNEYFTVQRKLAINNQRNKNSITQDAIATGCDIGLGYENEISNRTTVNNVSLKSIDYIEIQNSIPMAAPQLLYRLEQVNAIENQSDENGIETSENTPSKKYRHACCSKMLEKHQKIRDLGEDIVNIIETWCNNLPIDNDESTNRELKENVATKLYQKLGELNMNPKYFNDDVLYRKLFAEEIESQINALPQNKKIKGAKGDLTKQLLEDITKKREEIAERASGVKYKNDLEKAIDSSMPYPVLTYQEDAPGFKIYKDRLASLFILENFDHSVDAVKLNYEKRIRHDIDKYFKDVQMRNTVPLTTDNIFNELYSALYNVPHPNETSIAEEVEVIKTRCEIESWFDSLPLKDAADEDDLLERDQILAMLARRLLEMEKYEENSDSKMHKEIVKWLLRLPLLSGHESNVDDFAKDLQRKLRATIQKRKCVSRNENKAPDENKGILGTSQIAGPSNMPICCRRSITKRPMDFILESVEKWCQKLPLSANTPHEKDKVRIIKDNLAVKIVMKISELINPNTIDDDFLYDALLDDAIDNLLTSLPTSPELIESRDIRKNQLMDAIKSVKPLMKEEKERYEYKREIKNTVNNILKVPLNESTDKSIILNTLTEEIADNFIILNYYKSDEEGSRIKSKVYNAIETIFSLVKDVNVEMPSNPLVKGDQLLSELSKIPVPGDNAIVQEVQEIEMKSKVSKFLKDLFTNDVNKLKEINKVKRTLVKILVDYENNENFQKTKAEVIKCLKKIDEDVDIQKVESFIKTLTDSPPNRNYDQSYDDSISQKQRSLSKLVYGTDIDTLNKNTDEKWLSLLPITPEDQEDNNFQTIPEVEQFHQSKDETRGNKNNTERSLNQPDNSYKSFERGPLLSSSIGKDDSVLPPKQVDNQYNNYDENRGRSPRKDQTVQNQISSGRDHKAKPDDKRKKETQNIEDDDIQKYVEKEPTSIDLNSNPADHRNSKIRQDIATQQSETPSQTAHVPEPRHPCREERPCPMISQHIPVVRRPCRRPSLTIFCPSYLEPEARDNRNYQRKSKLQVFDDEDGQCSCVTRERPSQSWCPVHRQHYCRCCNRRNPLQCGTHRYPHFYRY